MPLDSAWPVPFLLNPQHLEPDAVVAFCVSALLALMINAEAQAFVAAFLGDSRVDAKDRFNFNAFLHLSILGSICFLVGGFGWPRTMDIDRSKFKHPRLHTVVVRTAGPLANLLLASVAGSAVMFMNMLQWEPRVFLMVIGVNLTTAVYNLIILPPLAGGVLVNELIPPQYATYKQWFCLAGPYLILALALLDRLTPHGLISPYLNPTVLAIFDFLKKG
jgi:Zn-dependent protease